VVTLVVTGAGRAAASEGRSEPSRVTGLTETAAQQGEKAWSYARKIYCEGGTDVYVTGYMYHGRGTYSRERVDELNEKAWGGGLGRTMADERNNADSLYFLANMDSHRQAQFTAGYAKLWRWTAATDARAGVGFTLFLLSRADYFSRLPFPGLLPIASLEVGRFALQATYVPLLPAGTGDVLFLFGKIRL
jgi:palmitoyl transferase